MAQSIEFLQLLNSLPEELYNKILDIYRKMYIYPEIQKKRINTNNEKIITHNLRDMYDFYQFNSELQKTNYKYKENFQYNAKCIIGVLEYYYSLNYNERNLLKAFIIGNDGNDDNDGNDGNYNKLTRFLQNKDLSYLFDPEDIHSGSSGMWIYKIVFQFMFGTHNEKLNLWCKLIDSYF